MEFNIFPWQRGEEPYWVNPENGIAWYVDKDTTYWCGRETVNGHPILDAVVFYVTKKEGDTVHALSRVMVDKKTNAVLADETSMEALAVKIDMIRFSMSFSD
jgi:hypothetical protein